ncbi:unnamed protein product [Paramecium sonneborni]|uniref:Uncharacterized protein n=1 Tax=Paramecium sonneborni TaxID=65129 RepID=A0A8S1P7W8_9CILI|nr:unnamed protein product [Paramecium sonneborni]
MNDFSSVNGKCKTLYLVQQCDSTLGSEKLGTDSSTILSNGSLISSIAMIFYSYGITSPMTINSWLKQNNRYSSRDLFIWFSKKDFGCSLAKCIQIRFDQQDSMMEIIQFQVQMKKLIMFQ